MGKDAISKYLRILVIYSSLIIHQLKAILRNPRSLGHGFKP
jgi:hypothetical protein